MVRELRNDLLKGSAEMRVLRYQWRRLVRVLSKQSRGVNVNGCRHCLVRIECFLNGSVSH